MTSHKALRLGTRASALARWQADWVASRLRELGVEVELVTITTQGDVKTEPIDQVGGQGLFTKQIQQALLNCEIDLAVHSLKDLPTEPIEGLTIAAVPERTSVGDVLVSNRADSMDGLGSGARVGTGSLRRRTQLLHVRPDLEMHDIRGNVDTRLKKLDKGQYDAIILAEAGLIRLALQHRITQVIPRDVMLPAVGQGALALESRSDDPETLACISQLDDPDARAAVTAERAMLATLHGGCLAPIGAWGRIDKESLSLDGVVLSRDGSKKINAALSGSRQRAAQLGQEAAEMLLEKGASDLISASREFK